MEGCPVFKNFNSIKNIYKRQWWINYKKLLVKKKNFNRVANNKYIIKLLYDGRYYLVGL